MLLDLLCVVELVMLISFRCLWAELWYLDEL